jgi:phenylacetate-CoA ligase
MAVLDKHVEDRKRPESDRYWSAQDRWSRDKIRQVQEEKLLAAGPFLYENSLFYRRRFERLGLLPSDIGAFEDLAARWPVVTKEEMTEDALAHPPFGTYTSLGEDEWADRGWLHFSSSGSSGVPRVFRYSHFDRALWAQANARALWAGGLRRGDTIFMATGYGPHVFAWGVQAAAQQMEIPIIPGGGLDSTARAGFISRFKPTVLLCTPSYALYLGRVLEQSGADPALSSVRLIISGGEPFSSVSGTLERIQTLWGARMLEFYGCTEASPHCGGYSCPEYQAGETPFIHLMEDIQFWETVDPVTQAVTAPGERGLTVCTNLNSESSPQLRFLVGDFTTLDKEPCGCGRSHVRAMGCISGRADDLISLRGIKFFPGQIEQAIRAVPEVGDEFQILLETDANGLDVMTVTVEHASGDAADTVARQIRARCEVRCDVKVVAPGTLPKSEHKARRVADRRAK